jgi:UDP-glucose 4-epimerase
MALYLITGGCGFIGSHLADALLAAGHQVRILDDLSTGRLENKPEGTEFLEGSVIDPRAVATAMQGVSGCFHLAAVASVERSSIEWTDTHRTNLTGSVTVFDAARRQATPVPVVYASSAAVYGNNDNIPLTEATTPRPLSAYGADKLGSEQHAFVASHVHQVPTCGLRFFNVFGPRQDPTSPYSGVISIFCNRLATGRGITIFGDGQQVRDFIFVGDVVRALMRSMERISCEARVFNVCTGRGVTVFNLARSIQDILGVSVEPTYAPARPGEVRRSIGDPTLARAVLGFEATVNLRSGLRELLLNTGSAQVQRRPSEQRSSFSTEAPALLV